jgi:hypothetical protein
MAELFAELLTQLFLELLAKLFSMMPSLPFSSERPPR